MKKKANTKNGKSHDRQLREHLFFLLDGGGAHARFDDAVKDLPENLRGVKPQEYPHTAWMLLEHLRLAQWDILEFSINPKYKAHKWPEDYWPKSEAPANAAAWDKSIREFRRDLKSMQDLVANPKTDLFALIPWGEGQTILREAMLLADHNAYHIGQLVDVRRLLGAWH
ncbi:MAG TPA: DinB family protein [Candidatus Binatia bacterium]|nr:DinB family protein [Candidatus Binatia bacterium]